LDAFATFEEDKLTTAAATRTNFIARYSVVVFFILAMVLGAGTVYLVVQGILAPGVALASALSASLAGIIMTAVEDGRDGLKLMLNRLLIWRVGIGYWLFALLFLVPAVLVGSMVNPLFGGDPLSSSHIKPAFEIVPMFIIFFIVAGLGQELGWTGFLAPRLEARYSALTSCVIRAILGGLWHLPLFYYSRFQLPALADFPYSGWIAQKGFLATIVILFLMFLLPWSIFFNWIFNNTRGSLLLVAVLHGSEIWVAYCMLSAGINPRNLDNYWGYGVVLVVTAIMIVITTGPQNLSRKYTRIVHSSSFG
jgi:membrane protease YdiL (CAAX protease family)